MTDLLTMVYDEREKIELCYFIKKEKSILECVNTYLEFLENHLLYGSDSDIKYAFQEANELEGFLRGLYLGDKIDYETYSFLSVKMIISEILKYM